MAYDGKGKCLDLTSKVNEGKLTWKAPAGEWQLIALFEGKTLQKVKRAAPGGEGYVMDHLNPKAVKNYFAKFDQAFKKSQTDWPRSFFNDSYEVYGADWTPGLLEEFAKRRGYRLEEHFPEFLDETRPETSRRILSDYRETVSEMLIDNFTTQWTKWAHGHGSTTRNQAHGSPANLIDTYASVDIPECEGFGLTDFHIKGLRRDSLTRPQFFRHFHAEVCFIGCTYLRKALYFFGNFHVAYRPLPHFPVTMQTRHGPDVRIWRKPHVLSRHAILASRSNMARMAVLCHCQYVAHQFHLARCTGIL